jgi:hypothetical protein
MFEKRNKKSLKFIQLVFILVIFLIKAKCIIKVEEEIIEEFKN